MRRRRLHRRQRRPVPRAVRRRRDRRTRESHPERRGHGRVVPLGQGLRAAAQPQLRGHAAAGRPLTRDVAAQRDIVPHAVLPRVGAVHPAARQEHRLPQGLRQVLCRSLRLWPRVSALPQLPARAALLCRAAARGRRAVVRRVAARDGVVPHHARRRRRRLARLHRRGLGALHVHHLLRRAREGQASALRDVLEHAPLLHHLLYRTLLPRLGLLDVGAGDDGPVRPRPVLCSNFLPREEAVRARASVLLGQTWQARRRDAPV
mmetsp:Transcript_73570/g.221119  ORF Transcript_73570/g.221119 Transcript_73570/m.221119 type:complete len:262 (+) Transcript_73570:457-1242(+)